jgi:hypothetical protein
MMLETMMSSISVNPDVVTRDLLISSSPRD